MTHNDLSIHFLQSAAWQKFQEAQGRTVFHRSGDGWEYRAILEPARFGLSRLYCPYGPTASSSRALKTALDSLTALARSQKAAFVRVQPLGAKFGELKNLGLHPITYSQPAHTWYVDVSRPKSDIIADMKQNNRNLYRTHENKGMTYEKSHNPEDISRLTTLLHGVAAHNQITVHADSYFETQATILLPIKTASLHFMTYKGETVAAALVYEDDHATYYGHAAADHKHRKLGASTALLAQIIIDAHQRGKQICDLYGITDSDDPSHPWAGFTRFKKSFGGYEKALSPTYEYPIDKLRYHAYSIAKAIKKLVS